MKIDIQHIYLNIANWEIPKNFEELSSHFEQYERHMFRAIPLTEDNEIVDRALDGSGHTMVTAKVLHAGCIREFSEQEAVTLYRAITIANSVKSKKKREE
jgi:hypothetical protein